MGAIEIASRGFMALVSFSQAFTIHKHTHFSRLEGRPFLVGGQWGGDDHGDLVLGRGESRKIHPHVFVT